MAISVLSAELAGFVIETLLIGTYFVVCPIISTLKLIDCSFRTGAYFVVFFLGLHAVFGQRFRHNSVGSALRSPISLSYFLSFACVLAVSDYDFVILCPPQLIVDLGYRFSQVIQCFPIP